MKELSFFRILLCGVALLVTSCKLPVVVKATFENSQNINCEISFSTKKKFHSINEFRNEFRSEIRRESRRCNCDTLIIDIDNSLNFGYSDIIGGGCLEKKE